MAQNVMSMDDEAKRLRSALPNVEKKVQKELDKALLAAKDSMERFEKEMGGYHLDTVSLTLKLSEKVLGAGTEQDIEITFKTNKPTG